MVKKYKNKTVLLINKPCKENAWKEWDEKVLAPLLVKACG